MTTIAQINGLMTPTLTEKAPSIASPPRVVLAGTTGRILCVADIRGDYHELNRLIREHEATAVIHTGDFGFINSESLERMNDKILRHLLTYSPLIATATRQQLLSIPSTAGRAALISALNDSSIHFPLSQFPHLLSGAITFPVPVFTVWGLIEDVRVLERFRTGEYEVHNLSIIDEAMTRVIDVGGLRLRLFGLGGAAALHKLFDNGEGYATIAGGQGTMWTTALQIGELVDTAQRVYDPTETRLFISSAPISRNGLLSQLCNALKADLTISGGLHFRYPASFNEFAVHADFEAYRSKLQQAKDNFTGVYNSVKEKVDTNMNEHQQSLLKKALGMAQQIPEVDDGTWTNTWHWVLSDASCGHMLLSIKDGRVTAETKAGGLNFAHRVGQGPAPPSAPVTPNIPVVPTPAVKPVPLPAAIRPPTLPAASGIPPKPPAAGNIAPIVNGFRPPAIRPYPVVKAQGPPVGPAAAQSQTVNSAQPTILARPAPSTGRPPRGAAFMAGQAAAAAAAMWKTPDTKSASVVPSAQKPLASDSTSKPSPSPAKAPASTGKSATPLTNGRPSTASRGKLDPRKAEEKPAQTPEKKPAEQSEKRPEAKKAEATIVTVVNGDKELAVPTPAAENGKEGHSRSGSMDDKKGKRWSLYLKGIPTPFNEDDVRASFGASADKASQRTAVFIQLTPSQISHVKLIFNHLFDRRQKNFAYVEFESEEIMNEALKTHPSKVKDTPIHVSVSNPPARPAQETNFRGGRGGFQRGRGGARGGLSGGSKRNSEGGSTEKKESPTDGKTGGEKPSGEKTGGEKTAAAAAVAGGVEKKE